jgi:hypothetical protein
MKFMEDEYDVFLRNGNTNECEIVRELECVALVRTDLSEESIASIIRVERISELRTLPVTSN